MDTIQFIVFHERIVLKHCGRNVKAYIVFTHSLCIMEYFPKLKLFAYCRESVDLKTGIEIQKETIQRYCDAYEITIQKWFIDNDASAYKYRPNFEKMWKSLDGCDGVIVKDLSRFGRSDADMLAKFNEMKDRGKRLILIKENIDSSTPDTEFFLKILALFADREATTIRERLTAGRAYAKIHGTKSGKPMHRPAKTVNWDKFDEMSKKGVSVINIARMMGISQSKLYHDIKLRSEQKLPA